MIPSDIEPEESENLENDEGQEEGIYFRATGSVYLRIEKGSAAHEAWISQPSPLTQDSLDPIALKLLNYRSRLHYDQPEFHSYLLDLVTILEDLHRAVVKGNLETQMARKHSVIVSGSELEFLTEEKFSIQETVTVHMTFTDYPYTTLVLLGKVEGVDHFGEGQKKNRVRLVFQDIRPADRDNIIRYVNHLQRQSSPRNKNEDPEN